MRICLIADAQVPHAVNWIKVLTRAGHEVSLISTYPMSGEGLELNHLEIVTLDVSARFRAKEKAIALGTEKASKRPYLSKLRGSSLWVGLAKLRDRLVPLRINSKALVVADHIREWNPDVVHAMRVTFEGVLAARAVRLAPKPLILSTWGNDFSYFAAASETARRIVADAVERCDGLHSDCYKDVINAQKLGLPADVPVTVAPGNGGVNRALFYPGEVDNAIREKFDIPVGAKVVLNPRGVKSGIRNDTFFAAMPAVLEAVPETVFLCLGAQGNSTAIELMERHEVSQSVRLAGTVSHAEMAEIFKLADVFVSPSEHDGTPNSMLEAMACDAIPVVTPLEGVLEWIVDDANGLLFDCDDSKTLSKQIVRALTDQALRERFSDRNQQIIDERASQVGSLRLLDKLYHESIQHWERRSQPRVRPRTDRRPTESHG